MDVKFQAAYLDFSAKLLRESYTSGENMMVSPLSVMTALAMLLNGAENETKKQLLAALGGEADEDCFRKELGEMTRNLPREEGMTFESANSLWFEEHKTIKDAFVKANETDYQAEVYKRSFNEALVTEMNRWVADKTHGMIDKITDFVDPEVMMYLINALAFIADWEDPFEENQVFTSEFSALNGEKQAIKGMCREEHYYIENDICTGFLKPYKDRRYSFMALLPKDPENFDSFIKEMTGVHLLMTMAGVKREKVDILLPKFKSEFSKIINDVLRKMGITDAFSGNADFSGISDERTSVGDVLHKTFIEVNEAGTKAAAVTAVLLKGAMFMEKKRVYLNRPFLYAIIDNQTMLPVFMGAQVNFK